ncbi:uncharacterized protein LOC134541567 [Bacillus rossius redtenbacheri]|uniref:uncharacterized protein LOC134541567 n=1 Tax=Bacillus rossius redtenbacheri TaxID=93214 RepID=UPI002FDE96CE
MSHSKYTKSAFKETWLQNEDFSEWLRPVVHNQYAARCSFCQNVFSLSNMGKRAVTSHMTSKKHIKFVNAKKRLLLMGVFLKPKDLPGTDSEMINVNSEKVVAGTSSQDSKPDIHSQETTSKNISHFLLNDSVVHAEIIWCLNMILSHNSMRNAASSVNLFPIMFPDSQIACKMQLQRTKLAYSIVHGLAPHFHKELIRKLKECKYCVVGFDESLNKVAQKGQMDITVRFWSENNLRTHYFGSAFLEHSSASDLVKAFVEALSEVDMKKILQISMDGPHVNFKFLRDLKEEIVTSENDPSFLDIGSCGLHTLHCAFKAAIKATDWKIVEFLRALYNLFKNVPARRADYVQFSGSSNFSKKFCAIRWLENSGVAERAVLMVPHLKVFVEKATAMKRVPSCQSFCVVSKTIGDKFLIPELVFFQAIALEMEPFLQKFQSDAPLAPLLYESLSNLLEKFMLRFVVKHVLEKSKSIKDVPLNDKESLVNPKYVDVGYATRSALQKVKGSTEKELLLFKDDCMKCFQVLCQKIMIRSPLKYSLAKGISCLDPSVAVIPKVCDARLSTTLKLLVESKWLSGTVADNVDRQFKSVCKSSEFCEKMKTFSSESTSLAELWLSHIPENGDYQALVNFLKMVFCLSHGNSSVERGFSINKECLVENLHESSIVSQRQVYDAVSALGGIQNMTLTKDLVKSYRCARLRYSDALKDAKEKKEALHHAEVEKRRSVSLVRELEEKRRKLMEDAMKQSALIEEEIKAISK